MSIRSYLAIIVLLFVGGGHMAMAQQDAKNQQQPLMTPVSGPSVPSGEVTTDSEKTLTDKWKLRRYEAAAGDLSACKEDKYCLKQAHIIKSWLCAADVCDGSNKSEKLHD